MLKKVSKSKIVFILSLLVLGALIIIAFFPRPITLETYSQVAQERFINTDQGYLIQFDILNHEGQNMLYNIKIRLDDYQYSEDVLIQNGDFFTYGHNIDKARIGSGNLNLAVYKDGSSAAVADINYHLK